MARSRRLTVLVAGLTLTLTIVACSGPSGSTGTHNQPATRPRPTGTHAGAGTDGFAPEIQAAEDAQSTFALDVDTASYSYATSQIGQGQLPTATTVRPEEFINAFPQEYPQPDGDGVRVSADGARMPASYGSTEEVDGSGGLRLLRIGLRTRDGGTGARPDVRLTFVVDVSGSMGDTGKLDLVRGALHALVDQLRPADAVAIVAFNGEARVVREMTALSRGADLHRAIDQLRAEGSTNLQSGLVTGYDVARHGFRPGATNRVVILSDGLANTGDTDSARILAQVRERADKQITLLGVGVGNDYGDALMEALADHGDGFVVYVSDPTQARRVFIDQLPATRALRALDAKAQVTFNPATVATYRLVGYDDRGVADSSFRNNHVDGGEVLAGHTVTALYAVRLNPEASGEIATARVRWLDRSTRRPREAAETVYAADLTVPFSAASPYLQVCYSAGYFAEVLRGSPYGAQVRLTDLADIASAAASRIGSDTVTDLAGTIRRAADLRR